jgi:hypothetical protein
MSTDGGDTWTASRRLTWTAGSSREPAIVVDLSGNLHVVWEEKAENYEIYYKRSSDGGATWTPNKRITWNSGGSPVIAIGSSGNLHVVWHDYTLDYDEIYYKKSTDGGANWMPSKRLTWTSGDSGSPDIAVDSSGNLHVVWEDYTSWNWDVHYRKSPDAGATWTASKRLTWNMGESKFPAIAVGPSAYVHVVWQDHESDNDEIYYRNSTDGGATWTARKRLTWNSGDSEHLDIAADPAGNLHVVWQDDTPKFYENAEIYYKKFIKE